MLIDTTVANLGIHSQVGVATKAATTARDWCRPATSDKQFLFLKINRRVVSSEIIGTNILVELDWRLYN